MPTTKPKKKKKPAAVAVKAPPAPLLPAGVPLAVIDDGEAYAVSCSLYPQPLAMVPYQANAFDGSPDKELAYSYALQIAEALSGGLSGGYFTNAFNQRASWAHQTAKAKGWWKTEDAILAKLAGHADLIEAFLLAQDGKNIALFTAEASEALEAMRHGNPPDDHIPDFKGAEAELADIIIRIMDVSQRRGWHVAEAIVAKMNFNSTRPAMHGGKKF